MKIASLVLLATALTLPAGAQRAGTTEVSARKKAVKAKVKAKADATARAEQSLYRAYWLDRVEKKGADALKLYRSFLVAEPAHAAAPRVAAYALAILRQTSRREARSFTQKYAALLERVDAEVTEELDDRSGRSRGRGRGGRGGDGREPGDRSRRGRGDSERSGERGRGRRDRTGTGRDRTGTGDAAANPLAARMSTRLPDMTKEQVKTFLTRYGNVADDYLAELRKSTNKEKAAELSKAITAIKKLIGAGELSKAQDAIDKMQRALR